MQVKGFPAPGACDAEALVFTCDVQNLLESFQFLSVWLCAPLCPEESDEFRLVGVFAQKLPPLLDHLFRSNVLHLKT